MSAKPGLGVGRPLSFRCLYRHGDLVEDWGKCGEDRPRNNPSTASPSRLNSPGPALPPQMSRPPAAANSAASHRLMDRHTSWMWSTGAGSAVGRGVELALGGLEQLLPGLSEFLHALVLEHDEHVGQVDTRGFELVEDLLRGIGGGRGGGAPLEARGRRPAAG